MRAKPDLVPDCDIHGEPMFRHEVPASALGLEERRDIIVWRCEHGGCRRYFYGTVGYRECPELAAPKTSTPRCSDEGAYMVAQRPLGSYICPVAGCPSIEPWQMPVVPLATTSTSVELGTQELELTHSS